MQNINCVCNILAKTLATFLRELLNVNATYISIVLECKPLAYELKNTFRTCFYSAVTGIEWQLKVNIINENFTDCC